MKHPIIRGLEQLKLRYDNKWLWHWHEPSKRTLESWWRELKVRHPDADKSNVGQFEEDA